jgi:hypothetical protein
MIFRIALGGMAKYSLAMSSDGIGWQPQPGISGLGLVFDGLAQLASPKLPLEAATLQGCHATHRIRTFD